MLAGSRSLRLQDWGSPSPLQGQFPQAVCFPPGWQEGLRLGLQWGPMTQHNHRLTPTPSVIQHNLTRGTVVPSYLNPPPQHTPTKGVDYIGKYMVEGLGILLTALPSRPARLGHSLGRSVPDFQLFVPSGSSWWPSHRVACLE